MSIHIYGWLLSWLIKFTQKMTLLCVNISLNSLVNLFFFFFSILRFRAAQKKILIRVAR